MDAMTVRTQLQRRPFVPFRLHLADGRHFDVPHPERAWMTPAGRLIFVAHTQRQAEIIDSFLVTSIEHVDPPHDLPDEDDGPGAQRLAG